MWGRALEDGLSSAEMRSSGGWGRKQGAEDSVETEMPTVAANASVSTCLYL